MRHDPNTPHMPHLPFPLLLPLPAVAVDILAISSTVTCTRRAASSGESCVLCPPGFIVARCVCKCKLNVSFPLWRNGDDVARPTTTSTSRGSGSGSSITISNATTGRRQASPGEQPPKCCCCCCCCQGRQFARLRVNHSSGEARRVPRLDFDILAVVVVVLIVVSVSVCVCRHPSEPTTRRRQPQQQQQPPLQPQPQHCPRPSLTPCLDKPPRPQNRQPPPDVSY